MSKKIQITLLVAVLSLAVLVVAIAQGQEDPMAQKAEQFTMVAQKAADNSNAPRSFAPCENGYAAEYPCHKVDLLSFVPSDDLGGYFIKLEQLVYIFYIHCSAGAGKDRSRNRQ